MKTTRLIASKYATLKEKFTVSPLQWSPGIPSRAPHEDILESDMYISQRTFHNHWAKNRNRGGGGEAFSPKLKTSNCGWLRGPCTNLPLAGLQITWKKGSIVCSCRKKHQLSRKIIIAIEKKHNGWHFYQMCYFPLFFPSLSRSANTQQRRRRTVH